MTKAQQSEREAARETLRKYFPPGSTAYTILRHVSRSGMSRSISVLAMTKDGPHDVSYLVARLLGDKINRDHYGVKVGGYGMDMGFALVYNMSSALYPEGFGCVGERCPASDHANGDRNRTPHGHRGPLYDGTKESLKHWHTTDGGYAVSQRWL